MWLRSCMKRLKSISSVSRSRQLRPISTCSSRPSRSRAIWPAIFRSPALNASSSTKSPCSAAQSIRPCSASRRRSGARARQRGARGNELLLQRALGRAILGIGDIGGVALDVMQRDIARLIDHFQPALWGGIHQVPGYLGLAIDRHAPAGQCAKIDAQTRTEGVAVEDGEFGIREGAGDAEGGEGGADAAEEELAGAGAGIDDEAGDGGDLREVRSPADVVIHRAETCGRAIGRGHRTGRAVHGTAEGGAGGIAGGAVGDGRRTGYGSRHRIECQPLR